VEHGLSTPTRRASSRGRRVLARRDSRRSRSLASPPRAWSGPCRYRQPSTGIASLPQAWSTRGDIARRVAQNHCHDTTVISSEARNLYPTNHPCLMSFRAKREIFSPRASVISSEARNLTHIKKNPPIRFLLTTFVAVTVSFRAQREIFIPWLKVIVSFKISPHVVRRNDR